MTAAAPDRLDRASFVPLYFQLQELLKEKIEFGSWQPGDALPSETELCAAYDVSRTVVRQALAILEQDGQIERVRGRGTFVAVPKIEQRVGGISRLLLGRGAGPQLAVLDSREQEASRRIADQLGIAPGAAILRVMSLLRIGAAPVALFDSFFPAAGIGDLERMLQPKAAITLPLDLPARPFELTRSSVAIETSFCSKWEAEQLEIPFRGAVFVTLCTEHRRFRGGEEPIEVARAVYRVDKVQFRFDVSADGAQPQAVWQLAAGAVPTQSSSMVTSK
ncbi:MAG TPA: GntR family transcriptional regulator [Gaiellales bacterium]|nr:GntR family transcriptional regulator [Gaiellales bacterium]